MKTRKVERIQHYHRLTAATLLCGGERLPLDCEMQRPGEDEVACGMRLLERVLRRFPRAFDLVLADALRCRADFFNLATGRGKRVMGALKDERRELMADARGLFGERPEAVLEWDGVERRCWDMEGFRSWEGLDEAPEGVRVVRSVERSEVRRRNGGVEQNVSERIWATTIPKRRLGTEAIVRRGRARRAIENEGGFNELVNVWRADHVHRRGVNAMPAFWLLAMLAFNVFHAFLSRNLKPARRWAHAAKHWAEQIAAEFCLVVARPRSLRPP